METLIDGKPIKISNYTKLYLQYTQLLEPLQEHDFIAFYHSLRVGELLSKFGGHLDLPSTEIDTLYTIGILHDVGKTRVPSSILNKQGKLDDTEWKAVQQHVNFGVELLKASSSPSIIIETVAAHHENVNGSGYPRRLSSSSIPTYAKMLRIVDSYDAMTSSRPYGERFSKDEALSELIRYVEMYYDSDLLEVFIKLIKDND